MADVRTAARLATRAACAVLPAREDGSKRPDVAGWTVYQGRRPRREELRAWFGAERAGLGLVTGAVSGNLEVLEFDDHGIYEQFVAAARALGHAALVERVRDGYEEATPGGGIHWPYRCIEIAGNTKLTRRPGPPVADGRPTVEALIETRGEGGFLVIAPSHGAVHPTGRPYRLLRGGLASIATIAPDERRALWELARTFDELPRREDAPPPTCRVPADGGRPGDEFAARTTWDEILVPHGWRPLFTARAGVRFWRRPGKAEGWSATTNYAGSDLLYVFSSSTPFEPERGYNKFSAYAVLDHGGDFAAAARTLATRGYGERRGGGPHRPPRLRLAPPRALRAREVAHA